MEFLCQVYFSAEAGEMRVRCRKHLFAVRPWSGRIAPMDIVTEEKITWDQEAAGRSRTELGSNPCSPLPG